MRRHVARTFDGSVNNRYLDCTVKMPRMYTFAEDAVKKHVQQAVSRGKVDVFITVDATAADVAKVAVNRELAAQRRKKARLVDPLQYEMSIADAGLSGYVPAFGWESGAVTEGQAAALEKAGIDPAGVGSAGKASRLLDRLYRRQAAGLATPKQIRCLERYGFRHVGSWTFDAAKRMIDRIAAQGWRGAPPGVVPAAYVPEEVTALD